MTPVPIDEVQRDAVRSALADPRSDDALFQLASRADDDDPEVGEAIALLQRRGTDAIWQRAAAMARGARPLDRRRGFDILAQLGLPERQRPEETLALILDALAHEPDADVLASAAVAAGWRSDERAAAALAHHRHHPDAGVRFAVVRGLLTLVAPVAIETLIELSCDPDVDVRDWATFGLGSQIELDTPQIRAALLARLVDPDDDVRHEAELGLERLGALPPTEPTGGPR